uniref:Uncharacterized protein n=1 Tax=Rhizophora mucronata TaxID=61149 RepID=A0A2P2NV58_RHIMU
MSTCEWMYKKESRGSREGSGCEAGSSSGGGKRSNTFTVLPSLVRKTQSKYDAGSE